MSKIMIWHVWEVTYLRRNVTIVCGVSYHLLGSRISWDSKIRFRLQVESYISNWRFSKLRHLASYVSRHNTMAHDTARDSFMQQILWMEYWGWYWGEWCTQITTICQWNWWSICMRNTIGHLLVPLSQQKRSNELMRKYHSSNFLTEQGTCYHEDGSSMHISRGPLVTKRHTICNALPGKTKSKSCFCQTIELGPHMVLL